MTLDTIAVAIATAVIAIATAVYAWASISAAREARRAAHLGAVATLFEQWGQREQRAARRFIIADGTTKELLAGQALNDEHRRMVEDTCAICNRIGYLVESKLVPASLPVSFMGETYLALWNKLRFHIDGVRAFGVTTYMHSFQYLAERTPDILKQYERSVSRPSSPVPGGW
jgi:hypothetical protein